MKFLDSDGVQYLWNKIKNTFAMINHKHARLAIKLNDGTTEGTDVFMYDGSAQKEVVITPDNIDALPKENPTIKYNSILYAEGDAEGSVKVPLIRATDPGDGNIVLIGHGDHETRIYAAEGERPKVVWAGGHNDSLVVTEDLGDYLPKSMPIAETVYYIKQSSETDDDKSQVISKGSIPRDHNRNTIFFGNKIDRVGLYASSVDDRPGMVYGSGDFVPFALQTEGNPVGSIMQYAGEEAPDGYLLCDGTAVSRTLYAKLFAVIGTTYGAGNGSSTFNLPDLQGRVPVGQKDSNPYFGSIGVNGGKETVSLAVSEIPAHTHGLGDDSHSANVFNWGIGGTVWINGTTATAGSSSSGNPLYTNQNEWNKTKSTGEGEPHNNIQPYLVVNYIIKF